MTTRSCSGRTVTQLSAEPPRLREIQRPRAGDGGHYGSLRQVNTRPLRLRDSDRASPALL